MQNRSRNWTDVQLIISSISIAFTLGFWGLLAGGEKRVAGVQALADLPAQPDGLAAAPMLLPGQVLYLGAVAPQTAAPVASTTQPRRRRGGGGGRSGGGGPAGGTGSSH
jgi:hypothetical protein